LRIGILKYSPINIQLKSLVWGYDRLRFDNIILDLDGTLVDSFQDIYAALMAAADCLNLTAPSETMMRTHMHLRLDQLVDSIYPNIDSDTLMKEFKAHYDSSGYPGTFPYPGVQETLKYLNQKGCRLFVATNKRKVAAEAILSCLDLNDIIEDVYTSDRANPAMNKEKVVQMLIMEKRLDAKRSALVGDTHSDWEAALYNGLFFIYAAFGYGNLNNFPIKESEFTHIDSFPQLIRVIEC
jgi:phosphoglycolate phosphatase